MVSREGEGDRLYMSPCNVRMVDGNSQGGFDGVGV